MSDTFDELKRLLARVADLDAAAAVLEWDQETYMPGGAATARAHQIATLRTLSHEYFTSDDVGTLLDKLEPETSGLDATSTEASLIRVAQRDFDRARKLPSTLVTEMAVAVSHAKNAWREARETNTYAIFAPYLARLIDLNVQKAEALGYAEQRYDALLDEYEPGMTTSTIETVFEALRERLVPIVQAIAAHPAFANARGMLKYLRYVCEASDAA